MPETPLTTPREPVDTVLPRTPWWAVATSVAALVAFLREGGDRPLCRPRRRASADE